MRAEDSVSLTPIASANREPAEGRDSADRAKSPQGRWGVIFLGVGLIAIGLNLRVGVAAIGPVLNSIRVSLGLSETTASLLTTIPVFAFGAFAFLTSALARRFGIHRLLGIALVMLAAGIALRLHPSLLALFAGTAILGAAIAVGNVAMPAAIKQHFAHHFGLMMGLYSTALSVGAAIAAGLTAPILVTLDGDWHSTLAIWAIPAVPALLVWLPQLPRGPQRAKARSARSSNRVQGGQPPFRAILTDPTAIAVTALMGLQSTSYYSTLTWVPTILQDASVPAGTAGWLLAYSSFPSILASLVSPTIAAKLRPTWLPVVVAVLLTGSAYLGLTLFATQGVYLWMTVLGLGQGASISLALTFIVWRSPDAHHTSHLSTMSQGFGYLLAGLGPIGVGALHALSGNWTIPMASLGVLLIAQLVAGIAASRPVHIQAREPRMADGSLLEEALVTA